MLAPGISLLLFGVNSLKQTLSGSIDPLVHTNCVETDLTA
jgi:hypothetical protein